MPIDFSKYVFEPRPQQQFHLGPAFRDLANARFQRQTIDNQDAQAKAQLGEHQAQRADTNSLSAATFAQNRGNTEHDAKVKRYEAQLKHAEEMRAAQEAFDPATVEAMGEGLNALGGTYEMRPGEGGLNDYRIETGEAPTRAPLDVSGMRRQLYGANGPQMGQHFSMPSPNGPGGAMFADQSPFGSRSNPTDLLPGMSAAAAGLSRDATSLGGAPLPPAGAPVTPPPAMTAPAPEELGGGPALEDAVQTPAEADLAAMDGMGEDDGMVEDEAPMPGAEPLALEQPENPYNPPAFSRFRNMSEVKRRNQALNEPLQKALEEGAPVDFQDRARGFNRNVNRAGMSPDRTKDLTGGLLGQLVDMYQTEKGTDIRAAGLGQTADNQASIRRQREEDQFQKQKQTAITNADRWLRSESLTKLKDKIMMADTIRQTLKTAGSNSTSANALIGQIHRYTSSGVPTDADYTHAREGVVGLARAVEGKFVETFLQEAGMNPDTLDDVAEYLDIVSARDDEAMGAARDRILNVYKGLENPAERQGLEEAMRAYFPEKYWPDEMKPSEFGSPDDFSQDSLGKMPLPATLDGSPKVSPNGVPLVPGRIGPKPPRRGKRLVDMTEEEINATPLDEMSRLIVEAEEDIKRRK
jgi:hypothetical protein